MVGVENIKVKSLAWNRWNREHIKKHNLTPRQVEQVFYDESRLGLESHTNRLKILGRCGKRLLTLVIVPNGKKFYVVTARDMSKEEREFYNSSTHKL